MIRLALLLVMLSLCLAGTVGARDFTISGVDNNEIRENIRLHLEQLPAVEKDINLEIVSENIKQKTRIALAAYAYYNAVIQVESATNATSLPAWTITVNLNQPAIVERVLLVTDFDQIPSQAMPKEIKEVVNQIKALEGKRLDHSKYENLKARLRSLAVFYGFFDFSFPLHKLAIVPNENEARSGALIHWIFYFGQRYRFGDVEYLEFSEAKPLVNDVQTFKRGDYFEQSKVSDFSIDLQSTNYFTRALARANAEESIEYHVPIEVILTPKPRDKYNFGIGISTDTGPRFTVEWQRPWVNLDGHAMNASLFVSRPRQSIEFGYRIPQGNPLKDFIDVQIGYQLVDENQTRSDTVSLAVLRQFGADPESEDEWDYIPFIRFSQEGFEQGLDAQRITTRLLTPGITLNRIRKRGDIFISWGDRQQVTIAAGSKSFISDIDFAKIHAQTKWVRDYESFRVVLRAEAGAIATDDFSRLPSTERFFAGGDQSIRGFGLNEISSFTRQTNQQGEQEIELLGGQYLAVGSAEYVYRVTERWGAAAFFDAGSASDEFAQDIAYGYGIGAHWLSPIGRVRFYIARGESDIENTWRIHLNIGPAL